MLLQESKRFFESIYFCKASIERWIASMNFMLLQESNYKVYSSIKVSLGNGSIETIIL